jgi:hypothetical protein
MKLQPECPVDFVSINENKVRIVAAQVFLLSALFLVTGWAAIPALLCYDFLMRSFNLGKWSLLGNAAEVAVKTLSIPAKPTDQAPKRFAARIGLAFSSLMLLCSIFQWSTTAVSLAFTLVVFALLESAVGFCAGCYVYSIGRNLLATNQSKATG